MSIIESRLSWVHFYYISSLIRICFDLLLLVPTCAHTVSISGMCATCFLPTLGIPAKGQIKGHSTMQELVVETKNGREREKRG